MSIYFCYRGDCDNLAYQQAGRPPFVAVDALGREWLCVETALTEMPTEFLPGSAGEMMDAQGAAHRQGLSLEGTSVSLYDCPDDDSLRRRLIQDTYPPLAESQDRLRLAGWEWHESWETGKPHKLTITNGRHTLTGEGETVNEAYYRMAQKALGVAPGIEEKPTMPLTVRTDPVSLRTDEHGVVRVGDSQVLLDIVIRGFNNGADPEGITHGYPTLDLADVYAVIAYYLRHRKEVDEYLQTRREEAERLRKEIEAKQPSRAELRAKLLARKTQKELEHASPGN
jgi:uncharacterized protein (DUF433 family)